MNDQYMLRHTHRLIGLLGSVLVVFLVGVAVAPAQFRDRVDNRGTEFHVAFLPTNGYDDVPRLGIAVWSERPTRGVLTYLDDPSNTVSFPVRATADTIWLDTFVLLMPNPKLQAISRRTIHLVFDDEVTVYGINTMRWSSDGFVALPDEVLGTQHVILSYPNTQQPNPLGEIMGISDFPSQFAVIATQDGTRLTIKPKARLNNQRDTGPFTVDLDAGEAFLAQAEGPTGTDLTGTEVASNKPVVVYGSHQRTNVPFTQTVGRDHLVEQLPPLDRWQTRAMVTPHFQIPKTVEDANLVRVLAAYDNTVVSVDSVRYGTLRADESIEIPLDRAKLITATRPILVAQYHHSSVDERRISVPNDSIGDPFMVLVPSREQFDSVYNFVSYATKDFTLHYINVVIPTERLSTIRFDGSEPSWRRQERIPKTSYTFATLQVSAGPHSIHARVPFGLYIYGYGPYNSYGYTGGYVFDTLFKDQKEPRISVIDTCVGAVGAAHDDSTYDFGMERLELLAGSRNVSLVKFPAAPGADSIRFRLDLADPYQDGYAVLKAVDTAGLDATAQFDVKGFTVAITSGQTAPILVDTLASLNGLSFCRKITLYNYGKFEQRIERLNISPLNAEVTVGTPMPLIIPPGSRRDIDVCFQHTGDTAFDVEVAIDNGCLVRPIAIVPLVSGVDSLPPAVQISSDFCRSDVQIVATEEGTFNSGIASAYPVKLEHAVLTLSQELPSKSVVITLSKTDPRQDLIYDLIITDLVGRQTRISDTIGGFTVAAFQTSSQVGLRFNQPFEYRQLVLGEQQCDSITLENYGLLPLALGRPRLVGNVEFSIPPEQLPIVLAPGERRKIAICVTPLAAGRQLDTLILEFNCGTVDERIELVTLVEPLVLASSDRCGNRLELAVGGAAKRNFLALPHPNPATGGSATITFGLSAAAPVTLTVYDAQGTIVERLLDGDPMPAGISQIEARVSHYPAGAYYIRMSTPSCAPQTEKLVIHR
jgi:hypothetical protein